MMLKTHQYGTQRSRAFSLIELVIVVVIIGIIGAVAVPRLSRGSQGASINALVNNLNTINKALDLYAAEHDGSYPTLAGIEQQLTSKTKQDGTLWSSGDTEVPYGPYLRTIPPISMGARKGNTKIATSDAADVGWLYYPGKGIIRPNIRRTDGATDETIVTNVINATELVRDDLVKD